MNFFVKTPDGYKAGIKPFGMTTDEEWVGGEAMFTQTTDGWKKVWEKEIVYINTVDIANANIFQLMGSPTKSGKYVFINRAMISSSGTFALRTGVFPAGSTLTIINEGSIRGRGGNGGYPSAAAPGSHALHLDYPVTIINQDGLIFGGGGGGGYSYIAINDGVAYAGGGGGAGVNGGAGGGMFQNATAWTFTSPTPGSADAGGAGGQFEGGLSGFAGGAPGAPGGGSGGAGGNSIVLNGNSVTFLSGNTSDRVKGAIS